jgi:hypothetical protein
MDHLNPFLSYAFQYHGDIPAWTGRFDKTVRFAVPARKRAPSRKVVKGEGEAEAKILLVWPC